MMKKFELTDQQIEKIKLWEQNLPKYKTIRHEQWYMFFTTGIGVVAVVKRVYSNGKTFEVDITEYENW